MVGRVRPVLEGDDSDPKLFAAAARDLPVTPQEKPPSTGDDWPSAISMPPSDTDPEAEGVAPRPLVGGRFRVQPIRSSLIGWNVDAVGLEPRNDQASKLTFLRGHVPEPGTPGVQWTNLIPTGPTGR
ncbi:hypothetical protein ABT294_18015 [Nonomuraea sp. NPDC000554]|uniref:hypothetical protein n=1 Tax=Nonomuraea sp. NPDC000554 TaxID=3154259 RepID=UPI0033242002